MFEVWFETCPACITGTVGSFGQGYKPLPRPAHQLVTEDDFFAYALYLERIGKYEEAGDLLDDYLLGNHTRH